MNKTIFFYFRFFVGKKNKIKDENSMTLPRDKRKFERRNDSVYEIEINDVRFKID